MTLPAYADRVAALLDELAIEHPAFVVGHSFGGGVGIELAHRRPDLVRSLTLVNSVGGAPGRAAGMVDGSWLRWMAGALTELDPREIGRITPTLLRDSSRTCGGDRSRPRSPPRSPCRRTSPTR